MNIEEHCDAIDAGFFSGDYFHDEQRVKEMEAWIARWQKEMEALKKANFYKEPASIRALRSMLDMYTGMVNSGDCGNWDPEEDDEVIEARAAIAEHEADQ